MCRGLLLSGEKVIEQRIQHQRLNGQVDTSESSFPAAGRPPRWRAWFACSRHDNARRHPPRPPVRRPQRALEMTVQVALCVHQRYEATTSVAPLGKSLRTSPSVRVWASRTTSPMLIRRLRSLVITSWANSGSSIADRFDRWSATACSPCPAAHHPTRIPVAPWRPSREVLTSPHVRQVR